jgi:proline dehydrogenase
MESSEYTDRTLDIFRLAFETFGNVGIVVQSYLYRSEKDIEMINGLGARIRLCKGAYREPKEVAFPRKRDVDRSFLLLARRLFEKGIYPAIATHDERMIRETKAMAGNMGLTQRDFEYQMLFGIRRDLQVGLVQEGYTMRVYVAYGRMWAPYFMRRLAERPANVLFLLKNLIRER